MSASTDAAPALRPAFVAPTAALHNKLPKAPSAGRRGALVGPKMQEVSDPVNSALLSRDEAMDRSKNNKYEWEWGNRQAYTTDWATIKDEFVKSFGVSADQWDMISKEDLLKGYGMMQLSRLFENACNQAYMQGHIRGFMHLDNGQEAIPAMIFDTQTKDDKKHSYYREHTHALASGIDPGRIMAELWMKEGGTCKGTGGSMHIYDVDTNFQGGWALVSEQLAYATGAARSILMDRLNYPEQYKDDKRMTVVFIGEGGAQNGRMAECLNAAAKEKLPILFLVIDNGRAINTFTPDVATNNDIYKLGKHYGVPGLKVDGTNTVDTMRAGRAVTDYVRNEGPAIMQVHTFRFNGHSPADPEHERGRKDEKKWARASADPIVNFEQVAVESGIATQEELDAVKKEQQAAVKAAVKFAGDSPFPPASLAAELEFPDRPETDYNARAAPGDADEINARTIPADRMEAVQAHIEQLRAKAEAEALTIGDAVNLAILEEMLRDPSTCIHAEDLQAGSSYDIPKMTQQTFGRLRASDEIIDEGHFIGKALGEGMNGKRPIVELMNTNFGIYGIAEISSCGNTYATTGGQFDMPLTILGAGGTAPNQALGAEHSQPFHAYIMGIPGLKICTASSPDAAYGLTKSMIRDNGPGCLIMPVKMMKEAKSGIKLGQCDRLDKCVVLHEAGADAIKARKAVTVLTYLHGCKEAMTVIPEIQAAGFDTEVIELRSLKPLDLDTIRKSLEKTNKCILLDESTRSGGVGATVSALIHEELFDLLDAPVKRLSMTDAPVPYASSMEVAVVKRGSDVVDAVAELCK